MNRNARLARLAGVTMTGPDTFEAHDAAHAVRLLVEHCRADDYPDMRAIAAKVATTAGEIQEWIQHAVRFEFETGEVFQSPPVTLARGVGDCDCQARLFLAMVAGLPQHGRSHVQRRALGFWWDGADAVHVAPYVRASSSGPWMACETTVEGVRYGEDPIAGAVRKAALRPDLARAFGPVHIIPL